MPSLKCLASDDQAQPHTIKEKSSSSVGGRSINWKTGNKGGCGSRMAALMAPSKNTSGTCEASGCTMAVLGMSHKQRLETEKQKAGQGKAGHARRSNGVYKGGMSVVGRTWPRTNQRGLEHPMTRVAAVGKYVCSSIPLVTVGQPMDQSLCLRDRQTLAAVPAGLIAMFAARARARLVQVAGSAAAVDKRAAIVFFAQDGLWATRKEGKTKERKSIILYSCTATVDLVESELKSTAWHSVRSKEQR